MPINLPLISVNGVLDAAISPLDRGFAYGDGVFETCRYSQGSIPLWNFHRERLLHSTERLKIPLDESVLSRHLDAMQTYLRDANITHAVVKITLTRGVGGRGYRLPDQIEPTYCIGVFPCAPLESEQYQNGVAVRICDFRLSQTPDLAGMKHLNRLEHILARAEWQDEFAEGLLLDSQGRVVEATVSNLFVIKNNRLYTPDLLAAGVAGVMRRVIIEELAPRLEIDCQIVEMSLDFVREADELFLCNSVFGIWPINQLTDDRESGVEAHNWFTKHHITSALQQQFAQFLHE